MISFRKADLLDMLELQRGDRVVLKPHVLADLDARHQSMYAGNVGTIVECNIIYDKYKIKWDKPVGTEDNTSHFFMGGVTRFMGGVTRAQREVTADLLDKFAPSSTIDIFIELPCLIPDQSRFYESSSVTIYFNNPVTKEILRQIIPHYLNGRWVLGRQETRIGLNNFWLFDQQNPITKVAAEDQAWKAIRALEANGYKNFATGASVIPLDNVSKTPTIQVGHLVNDNVI